MKKHTHNVMLYTSHYCAHVRRWVSERELIDVIIMEANKEIVMRVKSGVQCVSNYYLQTELTTQGRRAPLHHTHTPLSFLVKHGEQEQEDRNTVSYFYE